MVEKFTSTHSFDNYGIQKDLKCASHAHIDTSHSFADRSGANTSTTIRDASIEYRILLSLFVIPGIYPLSASTTSSINYRSIMKVEFRFRFNMYCRTFLLWLMTTCTISCRQHITTTALSTTPPMTTTIDGVGVHRVPLFRNNDEQSTSPYCLVASAPPFDRPEINFLSTQVWPSARTAALCLHQHVNPEWTVCEFGCGPGLPSLTAAHKCHHVIATDLDRFALQLVQTAATEQGLGNGVETMPFDLVDLNAPLPPADLYVLSDVFESSNVARGAARVVHQAMQQHQQGDTTATTTSTKTRRSRVWVFAQSDRAQREVFLREIQAYLADDSLDWQDPREGPPPSKDYDGATQQLWLCDVDETTVFYG